jgi:hypothetical protein
MILRVALTLALLASPWMVVAETSDSGPIIEVKDGQLVTMSGQAASLARLVGELCARTGTALRGYEADDRPITVSYRDVPLREVLQRMLRDETYMIGVRAGAKPSELDVSWLHVTGSKTGTGPAVAVALPPPLAPAPGTQAAKVPSSMTGFSVPPNVITQALGSQDAAERREATRKIAEHLEANPGEMDTFLSNEMGATADELAAFPFANEILRTLSIRQTDPVVRAKIDTIVKSVDVRRNDAPRKQSFSDLMQQGMPH